MDKIKTTVLSLGAGVQSTVMALLSKSGDLPPVDYAVFADTGAEPVGVYDHLKWLSDELPFPVYITSKGNLRDDIKSAIQGKRFVSVPFYTESDNERGGLLRRQCTREYKVDPIAKKQREMMGLKKGARFPKDQYVEQWIGISTDEAVRMKPSRLKWQENRWPLIELGMSRQDCIQWFEKNYPGRTLAKSACTFCPYHNDAMWRDMKMNDKKSWDDAVAMDKLIRPGIRTKQRCFVHRSMKPLDEVDFRNLEDMGQINMFGNDCEGMCGN